MKFMHLSDMNHRKHINIFFYPFVNLSVHLNTVSVTYQNVTGASLFSIWHHGVCLSMTSGVASLRQTSTRRNTN